MSNPNLPIKILNYRVEGPPRRKLRINFNYSNPTEFDICVLDAWITVQLKNGYCLADGKIFQSLHNRIDPAVIKSRDEGLGAIHIDLDEIVLRHIEEFRAGGDIRFIFNSRVLMAYIKDTETLSAPYETSFCIGGNSRFEYIIPQSEWIKILKSIQWSELELLELPAKKIKAIPGLTRGFSLFENAQESYRRGDWDSTMLYCRKAFEAIVQDTTGKNDMSEAPQAFISFLGEGEKAKSVDKIVKSLSTFLHLGRHENLPDIKIKRSDAEFSLLITGALLAYLGQ